MLSCGFFAFLDYASGQTPKCTNTPAAGERVVCEEDASSGDDIDILLQGVDIDVTATAANTYAVHGKHEGSGDIDIDVTEGIDGSGAAVRSTIDTSGNSQAFGVFGEHRGTGTIDISVSAAAITTTGRTGHAVHGRHHGTGRISLDVSGSSIETTMKDAHGIYASHENAAAADAGVSVAASSNRIVTEGNSAHAIRGTSYGPGDVEIATDSNRITTKGKEADGIYGYHRGAGDIVIDSTRDTIVTERKAAGEYSDARGILAWHQGGTGGIDIEAAGGSIATSGDYSYGIYGVHTGSGGIRIAAGWGQRIATTGASARGLTAYHAGSGGIDIEAAGGSIATSGDYSYGIYGVHTGSGGIRIAAGWGQRIATTGASARGLTAYHAGSGGIRIVAGRSSRIATTGAAAHGIAAYHGGTGQHRSMDIAVEGIVETKGANAHGVLAGSLREGNAAFAAAFDGEGYRRQTVTVTGRIRSHRGAGIFLGGGGRVRIGPTGRIEAASRIAILAAGDTPGANPGDPALKPKLFVGIELAGRRPADIIGDGWIVNEGGETTIAVNGVVLHDGAKGVVPGARAASGAWDVTIREGGVHAADRSDPASWRFEKLTSGVAADRDFSAADFVFSEAYAPRAALYEALPGFLLRLHEPDSRAARIARSGSSVWTRLSSGRGAHEPDRSSAAAGYNFTRHALQAGLDIALGEGLSASVSGRSLRGSADISAPGGGGKIEVAGTGAAFDICGAGPGGHYVCGGLSRANYSLDFSSDARGLLRSGVGARAYGLDLEAGRRMRLDRETRLAPRIRIERTKIRVDGFADAVGARVSVRDAFRLAGSAGLAAETAGEPDSSGGALALRASADLERVFGGSATRVLVSGEELVSEASRTRLRLVFGAVYRRGCCFVGVTVSAAGSGSHDAFYSGMLTFRLEF